MSDLSIPASASGSPPPTSPAHGVDDSNDATSSDSSSSAAAAASASPSEGALSARRLIQLEQEARSTLAQLQRLMQMQREQEQQMAVSSRRSTGDEMQLMSGSALHSRVRITDVQLESCGGTALVEALRGDVATLQQQLQAERQLSQQSLEQMRAEWAATTSAAFAAAASSFQAAMLSPASKGDDVALVAASSSSSSSSSPTPAPDCAHCHRCRECGSVRRLRGWRGRFDVFTCCVFLVPLLLVGAGIGVLIYRNRDDISMLLRLRRMKDSAEARMKMPFLPSMPALPPGAALTKPVQAVQAKFNALRADALALATSNGTGVVMARSMADKPPSLPASMELLQRLGSARTVEQAVQQVGLVMPCLLQLTGPAPASSAVAAPPATAPASSATIGVPDASATIPSASAPPNPSS